MLNSLLPKGDKVFGKVSYGFEKIKNLDSGRSYLKEKFNLKSERHLLLLFFSIVLVISINIFIFALKNQTVPTSAQTPPEPEVPYQMNVLSLRYFPQDPQSASASAALLDSAETGAPVGTTLDAIRSAVDGYLAKTASSLNEASKYHGYKDPSAQASLNYKVIDDKEFHIPVPKSEQFKPSADHFKILNDTNYGIANICDYVENQNVKEVWIWMYHTHSDTNPTGLEPIESNMAPKTGGTFGSPGYRDVSNSDLLDDLPRCSKSYSVFDFNYFRGVSLHNHGHHLEALFREHDAQTFLKFNTFGTGGAKVSCGTVHNPPNTPAGVEYVYDSAVSVSSDCQNWKPDGTGQAETLNCNSWQGPGTCNNWEGDGQLKQRIWWMQNMPGLNNNLMMDGLPMINWWKVVANWDDFANSKPVVNFISPPAQSSSFHGTVEFTAEANSLTGISRVEFFVDNQAAPFAADHEAPYTAQFDTTTLTNDKHVFYAKAYGSYSFGNVAQNYLQIRIYNESVKTPYLVSPKILSLITENNLTLNVDFFEGLNEDVEVSIYKKGEPFDLFRYLTGPNYESNINLPDGQYYLDLALHGALYIERFPITVVSDLDKDGYKDWVEDYMGTAKNLACGNNAWPPDVNNDKKVSSIDLGQIAQRYSPAPYDKRYDLNADGKISSIDLSLASQKLGQVCSNTTLFEEIQTIEFKDTDCIYSKPRYTAGDSFDVQVNGESVAPYLIDKNDNVISYTYKFGKIPIGDYGAYIVQKYLNPDGSNGFNYLKCSESVTIY